MTGRGLETKKKDLLILFFSLLAMAGVILCTYACKGTTTSDQFTTEEDKKDDKLTYYHRIVSEHPNLDYGYFKLAECYYDLRQLEKAILLMDTAIYYEPEDAEHYNFRGLMYKELGKKELALQDIQQSLVFDSVDVDTYLNLAAVYYYLYRDTLKAYEAMKKVELYNPELVANRLSGLMQEMEEKVNKK